MTGQGAIPASPGGWEAARAVGRAVILPDALFDGGTLTRDTGLRVGIDRAVPDRAGAGDLVWRVPGILSPGFVDLQVNGGGGVLFNTSPDQVGLMAIARAHRTTGTTALLPTLITDAPEVMERAAGAVLACHGREGIAGIHLEGPHISLARRGTHAARFVRPLDDHTLGIVALLRQADVPVMLTLAPEAVAPGQIAALVGQGVIVALGHSDATAAQTRAALAEGAQTFTHLFNAMSQMQNREAGVVGAAINSTAYCSFICDGIHAAPEMLSLAIRARPVADRMFLVSDAMPTVAGPDRFTLYGQTITVTDGRLVNSEGALAGAHVTMLRSAELARSLLGLSDETVLRMAVSLPARLMGLESLARVEERPLHDLILIAPDFRGFSVPLVG